MALLKLKIAPDADGYGVTPGDSVVQTKLDGGASRFRADIVNPASSVSVQWTTTSAGFNYLQAFYRQTGAKGLPFLADLIVDASTPIERTAHFLAPPVLASKSGPVFVVRGSLEVAPLVANDTADQGTIAAYVPGT